MEMDLCLVSAYLDDSLENFYYALRNFLPYTKLSIKMFIFLNAKYSFIACALMKYKHLNFIFINDEWMSTNIWAYRNVQREITNANILPITKIDFVAYVINRQLLSVPLVSATWYAWSDFDYFGHCAYYPTLSSPQLSHFALDQVTIHSVGVIEQEDFDLVPGTYRLDLSFIIGSAETMVHYQELYHEVVRSFQLIRLTLDEQMITLQCLKRAPQLFRIIDCDGWSIGGKVFASGTNNL